MPIDTGEALMWSAARPRKTRSSTSGGPTTKTGAETDAEVVVVVVTADADAAVGRFGVIETEAAVGDEIDGRDDLRTVTPGKVGLWPKSTPDLLQWRLFDGAGDSVGDEAE